MDRQGHDPGPQRHRDAVQQRHGDRNLEWWREHAEGFDVEVHDRIDDYAMLAVQGPKAREVVQALFGDASRPDILRAAGLDAAAYLIVTVPNAETSLRVILAAREVAPLVRIITRAEYINQSDAFVQAGAAIIRYDEAESAAALAEALLQDIDVPAERIGALVSSIRNELAPARRSLTTET